MPRRGVAGGVMTYINPLALTLTATQVQRQAAADKARQVRRAQVAARVVAAEADTLEHQVENSEAVTPVHDDPPRRGREGEADDHETNQDGREESDGERHIDVKA